MSSDAFLLQGMAERGFLPAALGARSAHGTPSLAIALSSLGVMTMARCAGRGAGGQAARGGRRGAEGATGSFCDAASTAILPRFSRNSPVILSPTPHTPHPPTLPLHPHTRVPPAAAAGLRTLHPKP